MLSTIDNTVVSGNFEVANVELDSDGETDHVYGVIRPKDAIGLRMLGIKTVDALLTVLPPHARDFSHELDGIY